MEKNYDNLQTALKQTRKSMNTKKSVRAKDFNDVIIYKTNTAYSKIWIWLKVYALQLGIAMLVIVICALVMIFRIIQ